MLREWALGSVAGWTGKQEHSAPEMQQALRQMGEKPGAHSRVRSWREIQSPCFVSGQGERKPPPGRVGFPPGGPQVEQQAQVVARVRGSGRPLWESRKPTLR